MTERSKSEGRSAAPRLQTPWLRDPGVLAVMAALTAEGAAARYVGGCVRNALLGPEAPADTDIDIAIDRPPEETIRLLEQAGLKAAPTGVEHGTVTAVTPKPARDEGAAAGAQSARVAAIEVTSLRRDVETDGRRAVVAFTADWAEDAARRDFTMNALYADAAGDVFDPLGGGVADLAARRLRFIGRAEDRIREDYLRILRYFRFYAWYGAAGGLDAVDLRAVARLVDGVDGLARERIGAEMKKLLAAPAPAEALHAMAATGALERALPDLGAPRPEKAASRILALIPFEVAAALPPRWSRRLCALLGAAAVDVAALTAALRLSKDESRTLEALRGSLGVPPAEAAYRYGAEAAWDAAALAAPNHDARAVAARLETVIARGAAAPPPPLRADEVIAAGLPPGPALGAALRRAEEAWIESGFTLDHAALLRAALDA